MVRRRRRAPGGAAGLGAERLVRQPGGGAPGRPRGRRHARHVGHGQAPGAGPRRRDASSTGSAPTTWRCRSAGSSTRSGSTSGGGIIADLTVTRLARGAVPASCVTDTIHRRMAPWIERHAPRRRVRDRDRHDGRDHAADGPGPAVAGAAPRLTSADLSNEAFPYLTAQEIDLHYARVPAMRVTYVGELGWELHVPADQALTVYDALHRGRRRLRVPERRPGRAWAACASRRRTGTSAWTSTTRDTPLDVGLGFAVAWDKPGGFIGRDALLAAQTAGAADAAPGPGARWRTRSRCCTTASRSPRGRHLVRPRARRGATATRWAAPWAWRWSRTRPGLPAEAIDGGQFEVDIAGVRYPARASVRPMYDPDRLRIKA